MLLSVQMRDQQWDIMPQLYDSDSRNGETPAAFAPNRVYIHPAKSRMLELKELSPQPQLTLVSEDDRIPDSTCTVHEDRTAVITVLNTSRHPMIIHKGEKVGEWEGVCKGVTQVRSAPS